MYMCILVQIVGQEGGPTLARITYNTRYIVYSTLLRSNILVEDSGILYILCFRRSEKFGTKFMSRNFGSLTSREVSEGMLY